MGSRAEKATNNRHAHPILRSSAFSLSAHVSCIFCVQYFATVVKACNAEESAGMMMAEFDENADNKISFDGTSNHRFAPSNHLLLWC
jgi:hypothetical protein